MLLFPVLLLGCSTIETNTSRSNDFLAQKGSLAWPTEGVILSSFGTQTDPTYGTKVYNPGVLIMAPPSAEVKSVYEGKVMDVYVMPEFGRIVTINHGEYVSLYGNLSSSKVDKGTKVTAGQLIGTSGTGDEPKGEAVFFAVFEGGTELNPEEWLESK